MIWVFEVIDKVLERLPLIKHYDIKIHTNKKFSAKLEKHQEYDDGLVISSQLKFNSLDLKSNVIFLIEKGTDGNVHYYFGIKNSIDFKSDNDDDILKSIHDMALRSYADNALSFEHIVSLKDKTEVFPEDEFEHIVKEINKRMFFFDEYGQKYDLPLFETKKEKELSLLITEMKKIGIEKLPYAYASLKPFIDAKTMKIHYTKHYKGYVDKLNKALSNKKGNHNLKDIINKISSYNTEVRNNAGGAFNHALFWNMLSPKKQEIPKEVKEKLIKDFGSIEKFKQEFEEKAKKRFGSGWVWLIITPSKKLKIMSTPNQDNPLMNIVKNGGHPILGLDLWEHSYYLKYQNKRDEYIHNFWNNINWEYVLKLFKEN